MTALSVLLVVIGATAVAVGAALVFTPAGLIVGGVELMTAAYVIRYLEARREAARRAG